MSTYKDDLDLIEDKKKDSKKLTLNALNAAGDMGLDPTYGGDGSGGGGEGVLVIHEDANGVLDKTWQEIHDAVASGKIVVIPYIEGGGAGSQIVFNCVPGDPYYISIVGNDGTRYVCASATDYPVYDNIDPLPDPSRDGR